MVHPVQVLLEVIETRPHLVRARAVCPETHVRHLGPTFGLFIVNAFLMTSKIINGAKTVLPRTIWHVTFELFLVASLMFSVEVSFLLSPISNETKNDTPFVRRTFPNPFTRWMLASHRGINQLRRRAHELRCVRWLRHRPILGLIKRRPRLGGHILCHVDVRARGIHAVRRSNHRLRCTAGRTVPGIRRVIAIHVLAPVLRGFAISMLREAAVLVGHLGRYVHMRDGRSGRNTGGQQRIPGILVACQTGVSVLGVV